MTPPASSTGASCSSTARGCQVLNDVASGWEGFCMGLQLLNASAGGLVTEEQCQQACCDDANCEVWQYASKRSDRAEGEKYCYTGKGFECSSFRSDDFLVYAGQRISHGTSLGTDTWCTGNGMHTTSYDTRLSHRERMEDCRSACWRTKQCSFWQYSTTEGCWSGYPSKGEIKCNKDVNLASSIMGGARFEDTCESTGDPENHFAEVFMIIGVAAILLCISSIFIIFCNLCDPKSSGGAQSPRAQKASRRQNSQDSYDDDEDVWRLTRDLEIDQEMASRGRQQNPYRALYPNANSVSPSAAGSEPGSMGIMVRSPVSGNSPAPNDNSFGSATSHSSFGTTPLLPQYPGVPAGKPGMVQPGGAAYPGVPPRGYPDGLGMAPQAMR